ncbi:CheY-like chemotaxis protein [Neorhizobium galegae]|uniref:response regulator n=1 Tax=Neorhizobium galegae TaxID=399 RepID=UPI001AE9F540|nr:response regulator [Neorhizobium galegae]MBP2547945.1 CheY-like chemotaxis protein [Neorhizobium galegae]
MTSKPLFVLVVEDEAIIRLSLVDELEDAGFRVAEAGTADEALTVLEAHPEITAIFTDIDMPGSMDGLKLAHRVHRAHPHVALLLTSGYLKIPKNDLPVKVPFLPKPYEVGHVVNHLRDLVLQ